MKAQRKLTRSKLSKRCKPLNLKNLGSSIKQDSINSVDDGHPNQKSMQPAKQWSTQQLQKVAKQAQVIATAARPSQQKAHAASAEKTANIDRIRKILITARDEVQTAKRISDGQTVSETQPGDRGSTVADTAEEWDLQAKEGVMKSKVKDVSEVKGKYADRP